jgi:hypothetical protein
MNVDAGTWLKSNTVYHFVDFRYVDILQIRAKFTGIFEASYTYVKTAGLVIVDFNIKIVYLIKADTKTAFVPFCQKNTICSEHLRLGHSVHKIEIPYIHKAVFYVLAPVTV